MFPRIYEACRAYLQENAVIVAMGRVSYKEEEGTRLLVEQVVPVEEYDPGKGFAPNRRPETRKTAALWLRVPSQHCDQMNRIQNLLRNIFDGPTPVYFKFEDTGRRARAPQSLWAKDEPLLYAELVRILGKDNVYIQQEK